MRKVPVLPILSMVMLLVVVSERPAHAYIDPGTASYLFQLIAGAVLGVVFVLRTYWNRIVMGVRSLVSRDAAGGR